VRTAADRLLTQVMASLSDHLGRLEEERWGDGQAQRFGRLEVDDQLQRHRLLYRELGRLGALEAKLAKITFTPVRNEVDLASDFLLIPPLQRARGHDLLGHRHFW